MTTDEFNVLSEETRRALLAWKPKDKWIDDKEADPVAEPKFRGIDVADILADLRAGTMHRGCQREADLIEETARQLHELARSHDQLFKVVQRFEAHLRNRIADGPPMTDDECLSALSDVMGALSRGAKLEGSL